MKVSCAVYLCILSFGIAYAFARIGRMEFYEGDNCKLKNSANGICKKITECDSLMNAIRQGGNYDDRVKCTGNEDHDEEIVCCPQTFSTTSSTNNPTISTEKPTYHQDKNPPGSIKNSTTPKIRSNIGIYRSEQACSEYEALQNGEPVNADFHIIAGKEAHEGEFPYIAALGYHGYKNGKNLTEYTCGGTLISLQYVLTAAHCVDNEDHRKPYQVRLGSANLELTSKNVQEIGIKNRTVHSQYSRSNRTYDVALLELEKPVIRTQYVRPICLQTNKIRGLNDRPVNGSFLAIGWGATKDLGPLSTKLRKTPPMTEDCASYYNTLTDHTLCAKDSNTTRRSDACNGDSGGPLLDTANSQIIIGVVAYGKFCGDDAPGVYMAVHSFLDWIENIVWPETRN